MKRLFVLLFFYSLVVSGFAQRSANVVFIGNSITYGALHQQRELTAPPVLCARWLSQQEGVDTVYMANCGRSGKTTYHFLPNSDDVVPKGDKTYFGDVVSQTRELVMAHPALPLVFSIMLGTNDTVERTKNKHTEPDNYAKNLTTVIDTLLKLWPDAHVVLNKPIWYTPDYVTKNGSVASKKSLRLLDTYYKMFPQVVGNCKPGHVHIGDSEAYSYFKQHWRTDINEEKDSRGKSYWLHPNEQGAGKLAEYWGKAILPVLQQIPAVDPLKGKKIGFLGDSYVRNHREPVENTWHYKFAHKHGMEYYNYGRNGNCIALDLKQWGTGMYQRYKDMHDDLDYVVVIAGHNDASQGRLDSIGIDTFKHRLAILCQGLIEKYPRAKLFFFTPWTCEGFEGSPRQQVVDAMLEVCGSYGIPVFDAARRSNIFASSEQFRKIYFQGGKGTDTAHLNAKGHDRFLPVAEQFILQYVERAQQSAPVILTAGQSNADGRVPMADFPHDIHYQYCQWSYGSGDFETATGQFTPYAPRVAKPGIEQSWGFDAIVYHHLEQLWQRPFYVIKHTVGGTAIDPSCPSSTHGLYWSADTSFLDSTASAAHGGKSLLKAFCRQIDDCLPHLPADYDIKCLIWHQGESDQQAAHRYYDNFKAVIAYIRHHLVEKTGRQHYTTLPVVCATFSRNSRQGTPQVADALRRLASEEPHFHVVEAGDLPLLPDRLHFNAQAAVTLGQRVYEEICKELICL